MTEKRDVEQNPENQEERLDEGLDDTFPASDPPSEAREPKPAGHPKDA